MKKLHLVVTVASLVFTAVAQAQTYDFTFTSSGLDATGSFSLLDGVATNGFINVTNVPVEADPSTLLSAAGLLIPGSGTATDFNGDDVSYDNQVNLTNTPILDGDGLAFGSDQYSSNGYTTLIGLNGGDVYGNIPPTSYTLFVGIGTPQNNEYVYNYSQYGTLTVTAAPEPSSWALGLIGLVSLIGMFHLRRRALRA
jgi:hypothetical protein